MVRFSLPLIRLLTENIMETQQMFSNEDRFVLMTSLYLCV